MSTPIRPPGGPLPPGVAGVDGASEVERSRTDSVTGPTQAAAVAPSESVHVEGSTAALLARLDAGEVSREQAIDTLVRDALELHGGAHLPPTQRAELESVLRVALLDDPALSRLLG